MSYEKKTWSDRQTEFPTRRKLVATNSTNVYDVERAEGTVYDAGDAFSASTMNDLESRIDNGKLDADLSNLLLEALKNSVVVRDYVYQVGRVIEFGIEVDPNETVGGTWLPFAEGRTTVGLDPNDADFNEVGKTGGSKTAKYSLESDGYAKIGGYANQPVVLRYTNKKGTGIEYIADTHATFSQGAALGPIGEPYTQTRAMSLGGTTDAGNNMQPYVVTRKWIRVA